MTVLELLELQARARAIRSQLALEPITKIELDTDSESEGLKITPPAQKANKKDTPKPKTQDKANKNVVTVPSTSKTNSTSLSEAPTRVKLKRNFGNRKNSETISITTPEPASEKAIEPIITKAKSLSTANSDNESRSSSPDVIAMHASPETLCISSDEEVMEKKIEDLSADKKFVESILAASIEKIAQKIVEPFAVVEIVEKIPESPEKSPEEGELSESDSEPEPGDKDKLEEKMIEENSYCF